MNLKKTTVVLAVFAALALAGTAQAAGLVLNEYSAVKDGEFLDPGSTDYKGYDYGLLGEMAGLAGGSKLRVAGNGDDWIELLVTEDRMDLRGWEIQWLERENPSPYDTDGRTLWQAPYGTDMSTKKHGTITFSDSLLWSDLRSGTLITIIEDPTTTAEREVWDANVNDFVSVGNVTIDGRTNSTYGPTTGDWSINICTEEEQSLYDADGNYERLLVTDTTTSDDSAGQFMVNNDQWAAWIVDANGDVAFDMVGEDLVADPTNHILGWGGGGVNSQEAAGLEDPADWTAPTANDYDDHDYTTFGTANTFSGNSETQDFSTLRAVVPTSGDATLDGEVNLTDLTLLGSNYGATSGATWATGDFSGDGAVNLTDLTLLGSEYGYTETYAAERLPGGAGAAGVPEPATMSLLALAGAALLRRRVR
jgi:hypothetical protein